MEFSSQRTANRPPIESRTEDGLQITFKATVQFQLQMLNLFKLYMKYGENYKSPCEKHVIETLNDAATRYDANSFFTSTDTINTRMREDLALALSTECFADVRFFQISGVDLPTKFENAI
jgi:regulator of protease activity HflC (stomatin/prohibitin superfamily)